MFRKAEKLLKLSAILKNIFVNKLSQNLLSFSDSVEKWKKKCRPKLKIAFFSHKKIKISEISSKKYF
jgi:hypothetical protein